MPAAIYSVRKWRGIINNSFATAIYVQTSKGLYIFDGSWKPFRNAEKISEEMLRLLETTQQEDSHIQKKVS